MEHQPAEIVSTYLTHLNAHRLDAAMACLSESFELEFAGADFKMSKTATRQALEWDLGTNGHIEWAVEDATGGKVRIVGHETNDFLLLAGIGKLAFRSRFDVKGDVITRKIHDVDWGGKTVAEALRPAVDWASAHEPEELASIYPDGRLEYRRDIGERWVALLRRWRSATT